MPFVSAKLAAASQNALIFIQTAMGAQEYFNLNTPPQY
jgi:hypothetical protein